MVHYGVSKGALKGHVGLNSAGPIRLLSRAAVQELGGSYHDMDIW